VPARTERTSRSSECSSEAAPGIYSPRSTPYRSTRRTCGDGRAV